MTYENFVVPNNYWNYVLEQKRITFINEFYKKNKQYPIKEDIQYIILTDEEKEKYKRIFYARYCVNGIIPDEVIQPETPILPPVINSGSTENLPVEDDNDVIPPIDLTTVDWLELPSMPTDDLEYYSHSFKMNGRICRNYSFGWSQKDRISKWVAYPMTKMYLDVNAWRTDAWDYDPHLGMDKSSAPFSNYASVYDRGNQIPSASRLCCEEANRQCFYGTVVAPQLSEHNIGIWTEIESAIRDVAHKYEECYVTNGVITNENSIIEKDSDGNDVTVPNAWYKAVLYKQNNKWYSFAYFTEHKEYVNVNIDDTIISIYELELKTNIEYFTNLKKIVGPEEYNNIKRQKIRSILSCKYNINTTGDTKLFITDGVNTPIEKTLYNNNEITLKENGMERYFNFNEMGDVTVDFVLKDNSTILQDICFSNTRIRELVIPSKITEIQGIARTGAGLFNYDRNYLDNYIKKIVSLNKNAPVLDKNYSHFSSNATNGVLYVPKGTSLNYASWMGNGRTDSLLAKHGWSIKELDE